RGQWLLGGFAAPQTPAPPAPPGADNAPVVQVGARRTAPGLMPLTWASSCFPTGSEGRSVRVGVGASGVELEVGALAVVVLPGAGGAEDAAQGFDDGLDGRLVAADPYVCDAGQVRARGPLVAGTGGHQWKLTR